MGSSNKLNYNGTNVIGFSFLLVVLSVAIVSTITSVNSQGIKPQQYEQIYGRQHYAHQQHQQQHQHQHQHHQHQQHQQPQQHYPHGGPAHAHQHNNRRSRPAPEILTKEQIGDRNRFWRHLVQEESLVHDGVNHYSTLKNCIFEDVLTQDEAEQIKTVNRKDLRKVGKVIRDPYENDLPILLVVQNAMHPVHVKGVQALAKCVKRHMPHLYESRAMYKEMDLDEDDGSGGNCPTHLAPLVGLFLPEVVAEMESTLEFAYKEAGWKKLVDEDQANIYKPREKKMYPPEEVGIRASEHLTYTDFPRLAEHHDGDTCYTMNFAFSDKDDYKGGEFFILSKHPERPMDYEAEFRDTVKPNKYDALIFLGGKYMHGVEEIYGGHREMFSTELWAFPDTPFGSNLWSNYPHNMETHVKKCNKEQMRTGTDKCTIPYNLGTPFHDSREDVEKKYSGMSSNEDGDDDYGHDFGDDYGPDDNFGMMHGHDHDDDEDFPVWVDDGEVDGHGDKLPPPLPGIDRAKDNRDRPNRVKPYKLKPSRVIFSDGNGNEIDLDEFYSAKDEPDFLIPKKLDVGEMVPIRWRDDLSPVDGPDGESFVIGFPPELHQEFVKYVANSGMMKVAHSILYKEEPLEMGDQRVYKLDDGETWTAMVQGSWDTDMVWLDPGDESCFESLLGILRRGNFDKVLDQVGKAFDLDGMMIQGVGAIFLSEYDKTRNMHVDIEGSRGSFYNVIVPVHIPEDELAIFKLTDKDDDFQGKLRLDPNVGVVLGGESRHGTGECNYRQKEEFRLSFAVYVADINESNVELIADDSTSLWPTSGDTFFFRAQKGRLWTRDGKNSIKHDKGRLPMNIQDKYPAQCSKMDKSLCVTDVEGMRLNCPKTCELYLEDDVYYKKYFPESEFYTTAKSGSNTTSTSAPPNQNPTCDRRKTDNDPSCIDNNTEETKTTTTAA